MYPVHYGQPMPPPVSRPTNGLAIASLCCGIAAWVLVPLIGGLAAVICGHMAMSQIKRSGEQGHGMAVAGLILGWVNLAGAVLALCLFGVMGLGCLGVLGAASTIPEVDPSFLTPTPSDYPTPYPTD